MTSRQGPSNLPHGQLAAGRILVGAKREEVRTESEFERSRFLGNHYYDGLHEVERVSWASSTETLVASNVFGERIDELLEYTDVSANPDNVYYAHLDRLGSVMLIVDGNGTIKESYRYDEFGNTTVVDGSFVKQSGQGSDIGNFKRFTGRERLLGVGLGLMYDLRARAYTPDAGRFAQRDRMGHRDGADEYAYARGNPLYWRDPLGLEVDHECGVGCMTPEKKDLIDDFNAVFEDMNPAEVDLAYEASNDEFETVMAIGAVAMGAGMEAAVNAGDSPLADGGIGDAVRHCVRSCMHARAERDGRLKPGQGSAFDWAHEYPEIFDWRWLLGMGPGFCAVPFAATESAWMDMMNNKRGRDIGERDGDCDKECNEATEAGAENPLVSIDGSLPYGGAQ